ncbi:MAG: YeeE/YedE thiosulfate transporter family protein [Pseudomonadota bacterium]
METVFTPTTAMNGGVLIGLAAVLLMFVHGRIAGATGILTGFLLPNNRTDWSWRAAMLAGMITAPVVTLALTGSMPVITVPVSTSALIAGGLFVGIGVTLGAGCTSGHGVCGLARFSTRSLAAVITFMGAAALTVFVIRHVIGG